MIEIDEEIKSKINHLADVIVQNLKSDGSVFINLQIEEEYSQYDVLFVYNFESIGIHQRGITERDLIISVAGFGCYGFSVDIADTDPGYYKEKLGVYSNYLAFLFNAVRRRLKEAK